MRFLGALLLGICHANVEPTVIPDQPKETKASVDARLALVAVCPEATSNCSVPTGPIAQNEELADALDCMLKINITLIAPGPCHDALEQFLNDHLNPLNRLMPQMPQMPQIPQMPPFAMPQMGPQFPLPPQMPPQFPMSPTMLIMRSEPPQPGPMPSPLAALLQRVMAASQSMMPFSQDPRAQPNSRFQQFGAQPRFSLGARSPLPSHGFPSMSSRSPMSWMSNRDDHFGPRRFDSYRDSHWGHSRQSRSKHSRFSRSKSSHYSKKTHHSHHKRDSRQKSSPHGMPSRGSSQDSSSSLMNPMMMMMILPHLMAQSSSPQRSSPQRSSPQERENPMSGFLMATMLKKMADSSSNDDDGSDYDYDYGYGDDDYDYDYGYDYNNAGSDDYDYEGDSASPSPLTAIIQQMLQQKLMAAHKPNAPSVNPIGMVEPADVYPSFMDQDSAELFDSANVEIAEPPMPPRVNKEFRPSEQVSYRSAP